jgi:hypothetical protein
VPLCAEPSEALTFELVVENVGGSLSSTVAGVVEIPAVFTVQSVGGCAPMGFRADASVWACDAGNVAALSSSTAAQFRLLAPSIGGSFTHRVRLGNDAGWSGLTAVTGVGAVALDPTLGRTWDAGACQGVNVTSISMCTPGGLVYDTLEFLPDAAVASADLIPATWAQSPTRRNLCFQSFGPMGGNVFRGQSLNARCFGGLTDRWETGEINFAAWIACY